MRDYNELSEMDGGNGCSPQGARPDAAVSFGPVKLHTRAVVTLAKALALQDIRAEDILARYSTWVVTTYGLECLSNFYPIEARRLFSTNGRPWPDHMAEKRWVVQADFLAAFQDAVSRFGHA